MSDLMMNGKAIRSLDELRENVDLEQLKDSFLDGTLEAWLDSFYYERQADEVRNLPRIPSPTVEKVLCEILGIDYIKYCQMTPEHLEEYERKLKIIRQHTDDEQVLSHVLDTATNQAELAALLNAAVSPIYLCGGVFTVPIRKSGVHYCGIGDPKMEAPFTQEQYRKAGITFEGVSLPTEMDEKAKEIAEAAAEDNGYDAFAEKHNRLASLVHFKVKCQRLAKYLRLSRDGYSIAREFFKSTYEAEKAAHGAINQVYDQANAYFTPGSSKCIAGMIARDYAAHLVKNMESVVERLQMLAEKDASLENVVAKLQGKVSDAETALKKLLEQELQESADYYQMYKRSYFLDRIEIEAHDFNVDPFDSDILNGFARLLHDATEYTVLELGETIQELEEDVQSHADTFFESAFRVYRSYCGDLEKIAEEIGENLSGDELDQLCQS